MMIPVSSSLSALRAYGKRMGVHANNVANMHSKDFSKSRVLMKEGPDQTVTAEIDRVEVPIRGSSLLLTLVEAIFYAIVRIYYPH